MSFSKILVPVSILCIGATSAFAGFTGDTAPAVPDDGNMHIMDTIDATNSGVMAIPGMVGNDVDAHGCKGSAGYSYSESLKQCVRPWEATPTLSGSMWRSTSFDGKRLTQAGIRFNADGTINARMCNTMGGSYTTKDATISAPNMFSTKMYCVGKVGDAENAFQLDGARYTISANGKMLKITTKAGHVFFWKKVK